jgi:hypothetical protein
MKAMNCLFVSLVAGTCASAALAGQDDVTKFLPHKQVTKSVMRGNVGGSCGFGTRASTIVDYYSNNDTGASSYIFYGGGVPNCGEHIFFEKGGTNSLGNPVGPVGSGGKIGEVEFWVIASDVSTTAGSLVDCTVTLEMFDHCVDWSPVGTTATPNTCMPSGTDAINQISLGGFYIDLNGSFAPYNGYANGYILDTCTAGLAWGVTDGNGFIDMRCWDYNGGSVPTTTSAVTYPTFNGQGAGVCSYAAGGYPILGYSVDNFYFDNVVDGKYTRAERFFFGGLPAVANLMIRLAGDDGCSFDLDGDGFVGGGDIDYSLELIDAGCPC